MKLLDGGISILIAIAVYSVVIEWVLPKKCEYLPIIDGMQVRVVDQCGLTQQEVISNFKGEK